MTWLLRGSLTGPSIANMAPSCLAFPSSLGLVTPLDCIHKASHKGLFPYLTTSLCLTKTPRSSYQNTEVQKSKFIVWLHWLAWPVRIYQLYQIYQTFFFCCRDTCCYLCPIQRKPPTPTCLLWGNKIPFVLRIFCLGIFCANSKAPSTTPWYG